ncbi:transmembrane protein 180-like [Thalassophryne amazonica]|uniref:transmembrane protein 180-like n=1 Tax=Thalassophryne amazonica TaxID=390379 RepID=UPI001472077A|nr:transmembrane protein 180-like [Thalassophryne amazonica]
MQGEGAPGVTSRLLKKLRLSPPAVAYSMTTLGATLINSVFSFYYVKLFVNKYEISEGAFHHSQVVYMVWNAVNDPLFGYLQDHSKLACCMKRRLSILYGAPLYSLTFLLPWFPWRSYSSGDWLSGVHLVVAQCAFDGMLTFVLLAQCALFAEMSAHHQSHLQLVKYQQVASLIGSSSILFCGVVSNNMDNFAAFQAFTVVMALVSCGCMMYSGFHSESHFDNKGSEADELGCADSHSAFSFSGLKVLLLQILTNRDFQMFVLMNFFQVFLLAFWTDFTIIFTDNLIPQQVLPPLARSIMYGTGFMCPQLLVLSCQGLLRRFGYYRVILWIFCVELGMAAFMLALGSGQYHILALFLTLNMIIVHATFSVFNLPLADIIDKDLQKYKRR